jgi:glyoxylase-like metal-dependent hydrolase (beta-lactamase superfamily II)
MQTLHIGDVTITSLIERDGPWRKPADMFPAYDDDVARRHLATLDPVVFDQATGRMIITYQTFVVRTPRHTVLIDTCTGEDKGYSAPLDFPKRPWRDAFEAAALRPGDITHVFCTHLHFDHTGWNTKLENGRWVPAFPNATYIFHRNEYAFWERTAAAGGAPPGPVPDNAWTYNCRPVVEAGQALLVDDAFELDETFRLLPTPGHSPHHCCVEIRSKGQTAIVTGDLMHHALQCREPGWSTVFDSDPGQAARSRRRFLAQVAGTPTVVLPIHFPSPTAGHVVGLGGGFDFVFARSEA